MLIPLRLALALAAASLSVAAIALGWYLLAERPARLDPPEKAFVAELREGQVPASLRRTSEGDLIALGERFCAALGRTGSSLDALFQDQLAGRVYDGQSEVVRAARRHLCPDLADRDD